MRKRSLAEGIFTRAHIAFHPAESHIGATLAARPVLSRWI
jgi:hypothetical protein